MGRLRIGIIGTDREALSFYEANRYGMGIEVTAVCGSSMEAVKEFAARKGKMDLFARVEELAESRVCDAVFISGRCSETTFVKEGREDGQTGEKASGDCYHRNEILTMMLESGKHVICQAPLALSHDWASELFRLAGEKGLVLMEALSAVYTPAFARMREQAGSLGTFREAYLQCCHRSRAYEQFRNGVIDECLSPVKGGGALYTYGIHLAACAIRLFGQPERVSCLRTLPDEEVEGGAVMTLQYPDMQAILSCSMMADLAAPSHILGEEGSMLISNMENVKDLQVYRPMVKQVYHYEQSDNIYGSVTQVFADLVRGEGDPVSARELSLGAIGILDRTREETRDRNSEK